uniref:Uncharacterized protein n=1 Tax=Helianthus annuus TaxID=4232 RepID=A0A2P1MA75_HELAN|nr:hypothetical protein [Helianthus annuus]AVP27564.1 hypothetical protein [Helianthus annuus]
MPLFLLSLEWRFKMRKSGLGVMPKIPGFLKLWRLRCPSSGPVRGFSIIPVASGIGARTWSCGEPSARLFPYD